MEASVHFLEKITCKLCNNSVICNSNNNLLNRNNILLDRSGALGENSIYVGCGEIVWQGNPETFVLGEIRGDTLGEEQASKRENKEKERLAFQRAKDRARTARWDLNIAIFLFAVLIIVIILLFQGVVLEIVAPVAVFGLGMVWLCGWRQGRQLFERFCEEELASLEYERTREVEETIEDAVRRAIRERLR